MRVLRNHSFLGLVFLSLMLLGVWATHGVFTKKFTDYDEVTLSASNTGLSLPTRADVKIRGVQVGEVLAVGTSAEGVELTLGLYPDQVDSIPANVTGLIIPKTLFGEKYVSLEVPEQADAQHIVAGDTITDTRLSTEVEAVLNDLYPLLRTVQPVELNKTLTALATALEGRGEVLGDNLETLDSYLKRINPQIPALVEDLRLVTQVSDIYADVLPEIGDILRNTVTTTQTLEGREEKLNQLFTDVSGLSDTAGRVLNDNGDNLIRLGDLSSQTLGVLEKYAPVYPCLLGGIVEAGELQSEAFRGFTLHINLETLPNQPRAYTARDTPRVADTRGPNCLNLPTPPWNQSNPLTKYPNINDGVDEPTGKGTMRVAPGAAYSETGRGYVGSAAESALIKSLIGPALGATAAGVPDLGVILLGPMTRGAEVSLR